MEVVRNLAIRTRRAQAVHGVIRPAASLARGLICTSAFASWAVITCRVETVGHLAVFAEVTHPVSRERGRWANLARRSIGRRASARLTLGAENAPGRQSLSKCWAQGDEVGIRALNASHANLTVVVSLTNVAGAFVDVGFLPNRARHTA